jgi:glycosyltransferase involved in cell wall biosynthesis
MRGDPLEQRLAKLRIGLNLLHVRREIGGAWNYIANVVQALQASSTDYEFVAYCTPASTSLIPDHPKFNKKVVCLIGASQFARIAYEQTVLPFVARRDGVQCMHWFANSGPILRLIPSVVTIHDMMFLDHPVDTPSPVTSSKRYYLSVMARHTCKRAEVLAPVSGATAAVILRLFNPGLERVFVIQNPLDPHLARASSTEIKNVKEQLKLPAEFWLYVAHPYPHKNHLKLFMAYKEFNDITKSNWKLVLRGDKRKGTDLLDQAIADLGIADSVIWLPRLTQHEMASLYSAANALIFPSLYEGGGIPVLEAMACGCPVLASDIATSREFAGDAALLFNAKSVDDIAAAMCRFYADPELRASCSARGLTQAEQYSSQKALGKLLIAYRYSLQTRTIVRR